jgi:hypothetical protein
MAKTDIDAKIQKVLKTAEETLRVQYEARIERELRVVEERARKYFESQEDPDISVFLNGRKRRGRGAAGATPSARSCRVCGLEGARNTLTGSKKKEHTRSEHEQLRAGSAA